MFSKIACLLLVLAVVSAANIPDGEAKLPRKFMRLGNTQYYFVLSSVNFFQAQHDCAAYNLQLVSVETHKDQVLIEEEARSKGLYNKNFWTSGNRLGSTQFRWMSTGREFIYKNWDLGYPTCKCGSTYSNDCLLLNQDGNHNLRWRNADCSTSAFYICENRH